MRELKPGTRVIGALMNAGDPFHKQLTEQLQRDCQASGLTFVPRLVRAEAEYDAAFAAWAKARVDAVFIQPTLPLARATALALQHQLATFSFVRSVAQAGALLTYASNEVERNQRVVWFVDRVLKGAQPATLPAVQPTRFDLIINQKTARALGVTVPPALLLRADEVID
jgi:putative ABC transport system substrate-binding protein